MRKSPCLQLDAGERRGEARPDRWMSLPVRPLASLQPKADYTVQMVRVTKTCPFSGEES